MFQLIPHTLLLVIGVNSLALSMLCGVAPLWQPEPSTCQASDAGGMNILRWFLSKVWTWFARLLGDSRLESPGWRFPQDFDPQENAFLQLIFLGSVFGEVFWVRSCLNLAARGWRWTAESAARSEEPGGWGGLLPCWAWERGGSARSPHLQQCRLLFFTPCYHFLRCK